MRTNLRRRGGFAVLGAVALGSALIGSSQTAKAGTAVTPAFSLANVGKYGGEPSLMGIGPAPAHLQSREREPWLPAC